MQQVPAAHLSSRKKIAADAPIKQEIHDWWVPCGFPLIVPLITKMSANICTEQKNTHIKIPMEESELIETLPIL